MSTANPDLDALHEILHSYARQRMRELQARNCKLAHYTTAENALKIIGNRTLWLRNAAVMNDHSEISHGRDVMQPILYGYETGERFWAALDAAHSGISDRIKTSHRDAVASARETTFMTALSEHDDDDFLGRLSMWRAYGGASAGVALVFNRAILDETDVDLSTYASPVLYGGIGEFATELDRIASGLEDNVSLLRSIDPDLLASVVSTALQFAMLSIKHKGFEEEREWRLLHMPFQGSGSARVLDLVEAIRGTPQLIYQLPFHNPDRGPLFDLPQITLEGLLYMVLIGPSLYPETIKLAFAERLRGAGVSNPHQRVVVSDIPLRHWG